ncbi:hypothetical protein NDU88_004990 [Pleurodeles waltl]|uniref:Uncharacterized protein n=1 Tax=Pleurodeles waltl TaxID=8319 RepID=A0AAV7VLD7_PLEWA|nr:hypothetical protein NDU88_004990 [Pleurodeles waltl]
MPPQAAPAIGPLPRRSAEGGGALSSVQSAHAVRAHQRQLGCQASYGQGPHPAARTRRLGVIGGSPVQFASGKTCAAPLRPDSGTLTLRWLTQTRKTPENA